MVVRPPRPAELVPDAGAGRMAGAPSCAAPPGLAQTRPAGGSGAGYSAAVCFSQDRMNSCSTGSVIPT